MTGNIIEVKNLAKIYNPKKNPIRALRGISFSVKKGEVFGILGVNGAGKSTTLNILIGLLEATSGTVKIFDRDFFKNEAEIKERMNIASAYADLITNLTVYQNLKIYAMLYGVKNYGAKIDDLVEQFRIRHLRNQQLNQLSAGQKTRVNLCKSLINDPDIVLLDEPTASLDPAIASHTRLLLLDLQKRRQMTIVFTSHNMAEVEQMCDRVALLHEGEIYMIDTPANLKRRHKAAALEHIFIKLAEGQIDNV